MNWRVGVLIAGFVVGGCSVNVNGFVGNEKFTGTVSQGFGAGTMNVKGDTGTKCLGHYSARGMASGDGFLQCDDGRQALIRYENTSLGVGYGYGTTNTGDLVRFYFGISAEAAAQRIGETPGREAAAGGSGRGSAKGQTGTGFFITRQGHVLTNAHVVDGCTTISIQHQGQGTSPAQVVSADKQNDLALLRADMHPAAVAALRGDRPVRTGEGVVAYGFPLNGLVSSGGVMTTGIISALAGLHDDTRYFQISAPLQPGNSGGPLLDITGTVIGVNTATLGSRTTKVTPQNVNFAIKSDVVRTFLSTNGISAETASGRELSVPDIGERARAFTVLVECKG